MESGQVRTQTVENILEDGQPVQTALEKEITSSPEKRDALYGGHFGKSYEIETGQNYGSPSLAVLGGGATSAAYTAAGIPGSEVAMDVFRWQMGQPHAEWWLFFDLAMFYACSAVGYDAAKSGIKSLI